MSLPVYLVNNEVKLTVELVDSAGNYINTNSVTYRVLDQDEKVLVASRPADDYVPGVTEVTVTIPSELNGINTSINTREVRSVEVTCVTDNFTIAFSKSYAIELSDPLVTGLNSFQSYAQAQLTALDIPGIPAWQAASEDERIAAMVEARQHVIQLNFSLLNSNVNFGQDQLTYVPEGQYQSQYVARNSLFLFNGNLGLLNPTQYLALPERFRKTLRQAQIVEADHILDGGGSDAKRQIGIIEDKIGETRQRYRATKALELPVCRRALSYMSYYVTFSKRIGRA